MKMVMKEAASREEEVVAVDLEVAVEEVEAAEEEAVVEEAEIKIPKT